MNDARWRCRQSKLLDPHPPPPCSLTEDAPRDRSIRLLDATQRSRDRAHRSWFSFTASSTTDPDRSRTAGSILRQPAFPRKHRSRLPAQRSTWNAPLTLCDRVADRSGPDSTNEVSIKRRHYDTHHAGPTTGATADEHTRSLVALMASNDEVERRGVAPTQNEGN
jgi:hypothetical protein